MHCWARYLLYAIISVLAIGQMGVACGQKGPLYMPEPDAAESAASAPVAADDSPEQSTEDIPGVGPQPGDEIPSPTGL